MKPRPLLLALALALVLAGLAAVPLFAVRNIDNNDLGAIRRRNVTTRMVCEFNVNGELLAVECYRTQQFRQAGEILTTMPVASVILTAAELDALNTAYRNRIEQVANNAADGKEAANP